MKIVLVTGGFDPLHSGHIEYFTAARQLGDMLVVGLNSDEWLTRKKGKPFLSINERKKIIENLKMVDKVFEFDDKDGTALDAIHYLKEKFPWAKIVFANGGDRIRGNTPEIIEQDVEFAFNIGGEKINSSSCLLEEWKNPKTSRQWGWYRVLDDKVTYKIKELFVEPGKSLSYQNHKLRNEFWYVLKGACVLKTEYKGMQDQMTLFTNSDFRIGMGVWHQLINKFETPCHILEIQYGVACDEEDIERRE